jgi:DNA repair exonuclease SbcCD ATPase subunit
MYIKFLKVRMKNFFSVGNSFLEINLDSHKKTLVQGANGASKSSAVVDSIVFALFGKPFRKTNKPNIINSINKGNLVVELEFEIGSKFFKIVRGLKPNVFEIYSDGILINQDASSRDYQEYLEKNILRVNYKSFTNVVVLGSASYNPFMQMSAADRRAIVEDLLDIQIFSSMNLLVKDKLSKLKEEEKEVNYKFEIVKEKIKLQKENIQNQKRNNDDLINKKLEEIKSNEDRIEELNSDVQLINKHVDILKTKINDKTTVESKRKNLISIESKIEGNLKKIKTESTFYESNDSCPTCKQHIDAEFKDKKITSIKKKESELNDGLLKLEEEYGKLKNRLEQIETISKNIIDHQSEIIRINASIKEIEKSILKENNFINELKTKNVAVDDVELKKLLGEYKEHDAKIKEVVDEKSYYEYSATLLKDGGIKTRIIKQYLPVLNKLINLYLTKLNFFVNFNINENFEEIIKSRHRDAFTYLNFSEGEKTKIDLSILFAFRQIAKMKNSVSTNLLLMDEIMGGSLDKDSVERFLELISGLDDDMRIFIIGHNEGMEENFDRILKFEKKKNFTRMTEVIA